jgi:hypothetical protein
MEADGRSFLLGAALAWAPWIPIFVGFVRVLHDVSATKATGLGAVAGGLTEVFVVCGIGAILAGEIVAIILLSRSLASGHRARNAFSILSMCLSASMLVLVGLFFWVTWFLLSRTS